MIIRRRLIAVLSTVVLTVTTVTITIVDHANRPFEDDQYTLLVMGSDQGPWRSGSVLGGRSDALHLIVVRPSEHAASILSFPRDLYVSVPGFGTTRINAALTRGPDNAVATVESLVGIEIDDYIVTGMKAFQYGIDEYGGFELDVPQRLHLDASYLEPGQQQLDGLGALIYGRDRKSRSDGDFGRNRAQAEILARLHADLVERDPTPSALLRHAANLRHHTVTSIPPARMAVLANVALDIDPDRVVRAQVPGVNAFRGSAAVVVATDGANSLFADLRDDGMLTP